MRPRHRRPRLATRLAWALLVGLALLACETRTALTLWHAYQGAERDALEQTVRTYNQAHPGSPIRLISVPYDAFADKLTSAIPHGNGPDLFVYPHDRIQEWADAGLIEPLTYWLDDALVERFEPNALRAMADRDAVWGLPLAVKCMALYIRTDLVAEAPATLEALTQAVASHRDVYPLAYLNRDLYGHAPFLFAFGADFFRDDEQGRPRLAINSPAGVRALRFVSELAKQRVVPREIDGPLMASMFNHGKVAAVISGPWFVADIAAGVPWQVVPLPSLTLTDESPPRLAPLRPFLGADALLLSARSQRHAEAFAAMRELTSDASAITRATVGHQIVANERAYNEPAVANDRVLTTFRAQLQNTVVMPKLVEMRAVWTPYKTALGEVIAERAEPAPALRAVEQEVQGYLRGQP